MTADDSAIVVPSAVKDRRYSRNPAT